MKKIFLIELIPYFQRCFVIMAVCLTMRKKHFLKATSQYKWDTKKCEVSFTNLIKFWKLQKCKNSFTVLSPIISQNKLILIRSYFLILYWLSFYIIFLFNILLLKKWVVTHFFIKLCLLNQQLSVKSQCCQMSVYFDKI